MSLISRIVFSIAVSAALAGCSSGPTKQINPPRASIQQLDVQTDGRWLVTVRLQNFSSVSTSFDSVSARLLIFNQDAGAIAFSPAISVGPESADAVTTTISPELGAKLLVASALTRGQAVRYVLSGTIVTGEPSGSYDFTFESTLNPAPGLNGIMR
jgi:hypothetical protein